MKLKGPLAFVVTASSVAAAAALKVQGSDPALDAFNGQIPAGWHIAGYTNPSNTAGVPLPNAASTQSAFEAAQAEARQEVAAAAAEEQVPQQVNARQIQAPQIPVAANANPLAGLPIPPGFHVVAAVGSGPQPQQRPQAAPAPQGEASISSGAAARPAGIAIPQGWSMQSSTGTGRSVEGVSIPPGWEAAPIKSFAGGAPHAMPKVQSAPSSPQVFGAGPSIAKPPAPRPERAEVQAISASSSTSGAPAGISIPKGWTLQSSTDVGKGAAAVSIPPGWSTAPISSIAGAAPVAMPKVRSSAKPLAPHSAHEKAQVASAIRSARTERSRAQREAVSVSSSDAARVATTKAAHRDVAVRSVQRARALRFTPNPVPRSSASSTDGPQLGPETRPIAGIAHMHDGWPTEPEPKLSDPAKSPHEMDSRGEDDAPSDNNEDVTSLHTHDESSNFSESTRSHSLTGEQGFRHAQPQFTAEQAFQALPAEEKVEEPPDGYIPVGGVALATPLEGDGPSGEWREQAAPAIDSTVPIISPNTLRSVTSVECLTWMLNHPSEPCGDDIPANDDPPFPEVRLARAVKFASEPAAQPAVQASAQSPAEHLKADGSSESPPAQEEAPMEPQTTPLWPNEKDAVRQQAAERTRPEIVQENGREVKVVYHKKPIRKQHGHSH